MKFYIGEKTENEAGLFICGKIKAEGFQFKKGHRRKENKNKWAITSNSHNY